MHAASRLLPLLLAALLAGGAAVAQERQAKQAVDDRADPHAPSTEVGQGTHFARKPLAPGAYFNDTARAAVQKYAAANAPGAAARQRWQIGKALPQGAGRAVPPDLLASLPKVPPGHRYVDVGGDLLLVASGSRMVVDGIAATPAPKP